MVMKGMLWCGGVNDFPSWHRLVSSPFSCNSLLVVFTVTVIPTRNFQRITGNPVENTEFELHELEGLISGRLGEEWKI